MNKIQSSIRSFFYYIANFRKIYKFKGFEKKLEGAVIDKQAHQVILMREISKEMKKHFPKGFSKYIPLSLKARREIKVAIHLQFGERMEKLHVTINDKLEFV